jgi:two-component sensor histidine kinase
VGAVWWQAVSTRSPYEAEFRIRRHDGEYRYFLGRGVPLMEPDGSLREWVGTCIDIDDRRRAEAALARQRDTLVREVHHRIKNHLQGITGLLRNRAVEKPEIAAELNEAIGQINTVAQVYGLQGRADVERVFLCDLLKMAAESAPLPVTVDCHPPVPCCAAPLAPEEAVPIALVVNELVTNAVKHIDPPDPARPVTVTVDIDAGGVTVEMRNAPARLPAGFDFAAGHGCGTGLELVRALLPRTGATLAFHQEGDAVVTTLRLEPPVVRPV